jgi:GxxExxY protein
MSADLSSRGDDDALGRQRKISVAHNASPSERDPQTFAIIGAAMEVHRELGNGFLEGVYQDAFQHELQARNIEFAREYAVPVTYKGIPLTTPYRADFVCFGSILVELKAQ